MARQVRATQAGAPGGDVVTKVVSSTHHSEYTFEAVSIGFAMTACDTLADEAIADCGEPLRG
jgi:hypothetical protein